MLGIGQITTRVAELIRGAMPFAIVNNSPTQSMFSRLVSYSDVQPALDAGWKWIKVSASDVDYMNFTVSTNYTTLESSIGATFTNPATAAGNHVINVSSDYCRLTGFHTYTVGGATINDRRGFSITGDYNSFNSCFVEDTDGTGFVVSAGAVWNSFLDCHVKDADDYGFYVGSQGARILGSTVQNSGNTGAWYVVGDGDNFVFVANIALNGRNFEYESGANNGIMAANLLDGTISNSGSGSEVGLNKEF